jgi:hypothetical protein
VGLIDPKNNRPGKLAFLLLGPPPGPGFQPPPPTPTITFWSRNLFMADLWKWPT